MSSPDGGIGQANAFVISKAVKWSTSGRLICPFTRATMAELALFPAIRKAGRDALVAATAYSCRKQIHDGLGLTARHPAALLELALKGDAEIVS